MREHPAAFRPGNKEWKRSSCSASRKQAARRPLRLEMSALEAFSMPWQFSVPDATGRVHSPACWPDRDGKPGLDGLGNRSRFPCLSRFRTGEAVP